MLDSVMVVPPVYDDSYYGFRIHEIAEMQVMNMGNYAHGNQPVQHVLYLYDWAGQPWKTQARVREVMDRFYSATPDGYCGDEDNGQTSAWYVFSALGFYSVCPGSGEYALGSPLFPKATVTLENGREIEITARDNAPGRPYIASLKVAGKPVTRNYITHDELTAGARLTYKMSAEPNTSRGTATEDAPYSFSMQQ
jgi:predicted alpha-1,2-mannosidase